jgi:hypothetical protein
MGPEKTAPVTDRIHDGPGLPTAGGTLERDIVTQAAGEAK